MAGCVFRTEWNGNETNESETNRAELLERFAKCVEQIRGRERLVGARAVENRNLGGASVKPGTEPRGVE